MKNILKLFSIILRIFLIFVSLFLSITFFLSASLVLFREFEDSQSKHLKDLDGFEYAGTGTILGGRDYHGCIPSSGYMWNNELELCVRFDEVGLSKLGIYMKTWVDILREFYNFATKALVF